MKNEITNSPAQKNRNLHLDVMKGILILLVVVGHEIQWMYDEHAQNPVFNAIYSFHMPMFMLVSGYVAAYIKKDIDFGWLRGRFVALAVPFIGWIFIDYLLNMAWKEQSIWSQIKTVMGAPDKGFWFLWVLFLNCCVLTVVVKLSSKCNVELWKILLPAILLSGIMVFPTINLGKYQIHTGMWGGINVVGIFLFSEWVICWQPIRKSGVLKYGWVL